MTRFPSLFHRSRSTWHGSSCQSPRRRLTRPWATWISLGFLSWLPNSTYAVPAIAQVAAPLSSQSLHSLATEFPANDPPRPTEWRSQVPQLLPTEGDVTSSPEWHPIALTSNWVSDTNDADGWRAVGSNSSNNGSNNTRGFSAPTPTASSDSVLNQEADPWVQTVLAEGQKLANGDRWSEALSVYQAALRKAPHSSTLLRQRQTARIHVDLRHRLHDAKYLAYAQGDSVEMAWAHLNEILYKIELNHLEKPNWSEIFNHGLRSLVIASDYPEFQTQLWGRERDDETRRKLQNIQNQYEGMSVRNHAEMTHAVREVVGELQTQVGLSPSITLHELAATAASALDTYSTFLSPSQFDDLNSQIRGNFVGIGVELRSQPEYLEIVKAIPGGPADRARIRGGDKMLAVNDQAVSTIGPDAAADLLRGSVGSNVTVVVETPEGKQYRLKLERARVEIPSIEEAKIADAAHGVGYIKLSNFQKNTPSDFDRALLQLQAQGLRSLILDLRDNPGGALDAAVAIVDRFVSQGTIVSTKGRSFAENMTYSANANSPAANLPLIVLINENSASASEILAVAIADHRRGLLMGERTFGKGVVQTILPLTSGRGGVRLTTAEYFSPTGQRVEMQGVQPEVVVQTVARPNLDGQAATGEAGTDTILEAAIRRFTQQGPSQTSQSQTGPTQP